TGWTGTQAQDLVKDHLPAIISNYTKSKHNSNGLQISIDGAVLLDGGTHGQIVYGWNDKTRTWTWNGNPAISPIGHLQSMYEEYHDSAADSVGGLYGDGRGTRSAIEAFTLP